jgi:ABC-2 type transport system ATP-binding protein
MKPLVISGLSHGFAKRQVLHDINLSVEPGSLTILSGPNGAGKTTLISLACGLHSARQGEIAIFGHSIRREPQKALANLGVVFQLPTLDLDLTVRQNLEYHAALHGIARFETRGRAEAELDRLGLGERIDEKVRALSGGLRRRVETARALVHRPRLLLMDEATAGMDAEARRLLLRHVRSLCAEDGVGVLWATHMPDEAREGDELVVLEGGRIVWSGRAGQWPGDQGSALRSVAGVLSR